MNLSLIAVGKTDDNYIQQACDEYFNRVKRYLNFNVKFLKDIKNSSNYNKEQQKKMEGEKILIELAASDIVVLLDENGSQMNSREFSKFIDKQMNISVKNLIFVIGGAFGFSDEMYKRANFKISLSKMTFSHQIIRLIFAEQIYRAFTIINNEAYHHD